jgi:hypothetical protein
MVDETANFALPSKPGVHPESPNSPRIAIRQQAFLKRGYCAMVLRCMSGRFGKSEAVETGVDRQVLDSEPGFVETNPYARQCYKGIISVSWSWMGDWRLLFLL